MHARSTTTAVYQYIIFSMENGWPDTTDSKA